MRGEAADGSTGRPASTLRYRPEIDGLRAVAVVSVALFHAGLEPFRGGFVGVDVFFVISGYLITSLIRHDLRAGRFSIVAFYERRARRLLPALFVVMTVSSVFAYRWMLPYTLESFGKSVFATSLFANNILLLYQSPYWAPAAEFNPLLNTWSLGVEEQYYLTFPFILVIGWRSLGERVWALLLAIAAVSLGTAQWASAGQPIADFYLLPARAWEFLAGSLVTCRPWDRSDRAARSGWSEIPGCAGMLLILLPIACFGRTTSSPGLHTLVPACGTALVLAFASEGTFVFRALSNRLLVRVGLMSYSLYLWHVPVFAFARIYSVEKPSPYLLGGLFVATIPVAYLSWRFVEVPFRFGRSFDRTFVFLSSALMTSLFAVYGYYLVWTRGIPARLYPDSAWTREERHIAYNERAFRFRKTSFGQRDALKILVVGNSFARDFINMTVETFDLRGIDIAYRDDPGECVSSWPPSEAGPLPADADVIVFASRYFDPACVSGNLDFARSHGKELFYIGTKHFGTNMNWIARLGPDERRDRLNPLPGNVLAQEDLMSRTIPRDHYVSLLAAVVRDEKIPITDAEGRLISADRTHLTQAGALFMGRRALLDSPYGNLLRAVRGAQD